MDISTGICPKCEENVPYVEVEGISAKKMLGGSWNAVSYVCPSCRAILGVQIDPVAVQHDTVSQILEALRKTE